MNRTAALLICLPLLVTGCSSGSSKGSGGPFATTVGAADAQTVTIGMTDQLQFNPSSINAKVGTVTIDVKNLGKIPHNLHFAQSELGKTETVGGGTSDPLKVTFTKAGTFTFLCTFHSGMGGKIIVT